jgi:hypothetical protein
MCYESKGLARTLSIVVALLLLSCGPHHAPAQQTVFDKPAPETAPNAPQASAPPRVQIDETSFDFGTVDEGEIVRHAFKVRNLGSGELQIARVNPG